MNDYRTSGRLEIPEKAFYSCMELERVKVPGSVDKVGSEAFANCPVLKGVYNVEISAGFL